MPSYKAITLWNQVLKPEMDVLAPAWAACAGAALFFALPFEPSAWAVSAFMVAVAVVALALGLWGKPGAGAMLAFALFLGLACVQTSAQPPIPYAATQKHAHWVVGQVASVTAKPENPRRSVVVLAPARMYGLPGVESAAEFHIGVPTAQVLGVQPGAGLAVQASLIPPDGPTYRGQRDGRWYRFWNRNVMYGYSAGQVEETTLPANIVQPPHAWRGVMARVEALRQHIKAATRSMAGGTVAALLMGDQGALPQPLRDAYRATGLAHLLAISGMQLTLVGGGLFFLVRWLLAWVPGIALRINTKVPAALLGMVGAGAYTLLAGGGVSVVRALLMVVIVLLAAMVGRLNQALRGWGLAVLVLLVLNPALVMNAGFQLSFAAVLGLLCLGHSAGWQERGLWLLRGRTMLLATLTAGAATAPLLVLNFGQVSLWNIPANLVAVPLMVGATYLGFAALVLWPVGLQQLALWPMEKLCDLTNLWAEKLAGMTGSVPALAGPELLLVLGVVVLLSVAVLWAAIENKLAAAMLGGVGMAGVGAAVLALYTPPTLVVWNGGATVWEKTVGATPYRLLWSDNAAQAMRQATYAGLKVVSSTDVVPRESDPASLPPVAEGTYAWAEKTRGRWYVQSLACGRVWQASDERCAENQ
jgi:competence protein ComEC